MWVVSTRATWPAADAPIDGVLELQIGDIGVWGPWLPPGWRLSGAMHANATFGGRFGAPEYVGELTGKNLLVRNLLQGVEVREGSMSIVLLGDNARIEHFTAKAGDGSLNLRGGASLGNQPSAELKLRLDQFQLLGRVDRRILTSGDAMLQLGRDTLALDGSFKVDEGLIDFSRSEAPALSADVQVVRGEAPAELFPGTASPDPATAARALRTTLNLRVDLGEKLRLRGQGLDTGLRGELRLTAPAGRLRVDGSVRTVGGTYRQVESKGHLHQIYGVGTDEVIKQRAEEKEGDPIHGKRFDGPVDEQGQKHRFAAFAGLDDFTEIDFDHNGIHHEKQADGNRNGHHRRTLDIDG